MLLWNGGRLALAGKLQEGWDSGGNPVDIRWRYWLCWASCLDSTCWLELDYEELWKLRLDGKEKRPVNATVAISASRHLINIQTTVQTHKTMEKSESVLNNAHCGITECGLAAFIHEDFTFLFTKHQVQRS